MPLYHFTPLAVGDPVTDEVLSTSPGRHSFYWQSVFAPYAYDLAVARVREEFPGAPDELLRAAGGSRYLQRCLQELIFESVRAQIDGSLPSRSECLFLFRTSAPPASLSIDLDGCALLQIEPAPASQVFSARTSLLNGSWLTHELHARAVEYWRGAAPHHDDVEVLLTGPFTITRVLREHAGNSLTIDGQTFVELHRR